MVVDAEAPTESPGAIPCAIRETRTSLSSVFVNAALRRMQLALAGSMKRDWACVTAVVGAGGAKLVVVTQDGRHLRKEGPGEFFGEIGLLRDVPRTATVTALEDTEPLSLAREPFLDAVGGTDEALTAA